MRGVAGAPAPGGLLVLLGGARSGKSDLAQRLAGACDAPVEVIVTARVEDPDMARRVRRHRDDRPVGWRTTEAPVDLRAALVAASPAATVIVDCLTVWTSNLMREGLDEDRIREVAGVTAATAAARPGRTIAVTNEVGMGVHPATELGRAYRDVLGRVNAAWVRDARDAWLVVAGRVTPLLPPPLRWPPG